MVARRIVTGVLLVVVATTTACARKSDDRLAAQPTPTASAGPCSDAHLEAASRRARDVYTIVLGKLLENPAAKEARRPVVYLADHGYPEPPMTEPEYHSPDPGAASASTERFAQPLLDCLASGEMPGLPKMTIVTGDDDPKVRRERPDGFSRISNGRIVSLAAVPTEGDLVRVQASSSGGGGLDAYGGWYLVERQSDGPWRLGRVLRQFIA
ncbi:MAG: hypothetical protein ABR520_01410 [Mycobacteriales bacterium]|nr:hypothetical protein [Frankia sp.]